MRGTIGIGEERAAEEKRGNPAMRGIFPQAHALVVPFMTANGAWRSATDEFMAHEALRQHLPEIAGLDLFALLAAIASAVANGRAPTP